MLKPFLILAKLAALGTLGLTVLAAASLMALAAVPAKSEPGPSMQVPAKPDPGPSMQRRTELLHLLEQDCGSCHGLTLAGGLGPSLKAGDLRGKPAEFLTATILYGRPGTAMPPWRAFLSEQEAAWLARTLKGQTP
ncbi:MAG: cytochrome c [Pseudomonadota bacterium]|nr:cytochrome c [Pseudomonadota bacterium]